MKSLNSDSASLKIGLFIAMRSKDRRSKKINVGFSSWPEISPGFPKAPYQDLFSFLYLCTIYKWLFCFVLFVFFLIVIII